MKITRAAIRNFRLLENADIAFDNEATIIVGRNNSGKTSLVEIFRKVSGVDSSTYSFDDLSLSQHISFENALAAYNKLVNEELRSEADNDFTLRRLVRALPEISITLTVTYGDSDNLAPLAPFILDLDPNRSDITIRHRVYIIDPEGLFATYVDANAKTEVTLTEFLKKNYSSYLATAIDAIDPQDSTNVRAIAPADLDRLISIKFIYAQNQMDDLASDNARGLSKGFESFDKSNAPTDNTAEEIAQLLNKAGKDLDVKYRALFSSVFSDLKTFGIGRISGLPEINVVSEFETLKLLVNNTKLYYNHGGTNLLPEGHNGLGYSKLIYTILMFIGFYEELKRAIPKPPLQLVFVEEPEAHLHPQMQYVFVKNIRQFITDKTDWNAQTVITTHSSHIVSESGFGCIRYFDNSVKPLEVRDLSQFESDQKKADKAGSIQFLKQYMILNRCDMFFADKAILIEGTVERLLLPEMMTKVSSELMHQYISVIEVGGAYAHLFKEILEFLNIQTLVITDIDSVNPEAHRVAARVGAGMVSSNQTIAKWIPAEDDITKLLLMTDKQKTSGRVRVAYQIPEAAGQATGRSFEEAFVLANASLFASGKRFKDTAGKTKTESEISTSSYDIAKDLPKKTDFAFEILQLDGWTTPRYIEEGLTWLSTTP